MNYGNASDARTYWTDHGYTIPGGWLDADITKALLVVSEWIDGKYESSFPGIRATARAQDRAWPRAGAYDCEGYAFSNTEYPRELLAAVYEAAFKQMTTPGALSVEFTPSQYRRAAVDGAVSVEYALYSYASEVQTQFEVIERAIAPILTGRGNASMLSGPTGRA